MRGFTLAELMVVIAIISLLAVVSLGYIGGQLAKGRDARRRAELEQIRSALEMYKADNLDVGYPFTYTYRTDLTGGGYMRVVPEDQFSPRYQYMYVRNSGSSYDLGAFLEASNPGSCASTNLDGVQCGANVDSPFCNYCVFDP